MDWADGTRASLGAEKKPEEYVAHMVECFRAVHRVLRDDGVLWLNMGDRFWTAKGGCRNPGGGERSWGNHIKTAGAYQLYRGNRTDAPHLKPGDLSLMPSEVARALRGDGWYLRQDVIWHKPNARIESVDGWWFDDGNPRLRKGAWRPTTAHEHVFLLTKSRTYFGDREAVKTPLKETTVKRAKSGTWRNRTERPEKGYPGKADRSYAEINREVRDRIIDGNRSGANLRSVWAIATVPSSLRHYAAFPETLVEPCIKAGTSERGVCAECGAPWVRVVERKLYPRHDTELADLATDHDGANRGKHAKPTQVTTKGWQPSCSCGAETIPATVLDPFAGSGTVGLVAKKLGRRYVLIDVSGEYCEMARRRIGEWLV